TGACTQILQDPDYSDTQFGDVAWSPDGHLLASGTYQHGVQVWEMTALSRRWVGHAGLTFVRRVAWSPDGSRLASCGDDGSICLWRASDGMLLQTLHEHSARVATVAWSPDGTWLASGGGGRSSGELFLWHSSQGVEPAEYRAVADAAARPPLRTTQYHQDTRTHPSPESHAVCAGGF
ncbi:MAG: hypothetical protein E6I97_27985, partial [Chloroflexi bacterium]